MTSILEKGGAGFEGVKLLLRENPLPPLDEAIAAAQAEVPRSNYYTEAVGKPIPKRDFGFDLAELDIPLGTTLVVIVNPNNPNGGGVRPLAAAGAALSMARSAPFDIHHQRCDHWFERHAAAYQSELLAVRARLPWARLGLSIGVGTGRFAAPPGLSIIDRDSALGQQYVAHQAESAFYRDATFYSGDELHDLLRDTGFGELEWLQTLSRPLAEIDEIESLRPGRGKGAFVAVRAHRPKSVPAA